MAKLLNHPFNFASYWDRVIPTPARAESLDLYYKGTEDLDYFSLKVEGVEISPSRPLNYVKYTMEQFKFEEDFNDYYQE